MFIVASSLLCFSAAVIHLSLCSIWYSESLTDDGEKDDGEITIMQHLAQLLDFQ